MLRRGVWLAVSGLVAPGAAAAQATHDSAGVRIVENERPGWTTAQALRLADRPALVIGTQNGEPYQLSRVLGAVRLLDGRVVVADGGSLQLRIFDSTGAFLSAKGGRGAGPGEFQEAPRLVLSAGDVVVALEGVYNVSYFSPDLTFLRRLSANAPPIALPTGFRQVLAAFADGVRVVASVGRPAVHAADARWIHVTPVFVVNAENKVVAPLGALPYMDLVTSEGTPRPPWFGATAVVANDDRFFYFGYGGEYAIRVYSSDGALRRIIRRRWSPAKVTRADIDAYVEEWSRRWIKTTGARAEAQRKDLRDDPYASTVPAFSQFLVDGGGRLWVREAHVADAPVAGQLNTWPLAATRWSVFDADGRWLGDVDMPARFQPTDIGQDYVLGVARNADDVPTVALYRLLQGAPAR